MRKMLVFAMTLALVGSAMAVDLGNARPDKAPGTYPENIPNPERQGGDTILTAVAISVPGTASGTTAGYSDDYDEICPYTNSTSPDVVYTFTAAVTEGVDVDLCGSSYDTKLYVYDENLALVACNDDFYFDATCGTYVSKIEGMVVTAGVQYFVVIDGYGGDFGDYMLEISTFVPCDVVCPDMAELEGEPAMGPDYADAHNGGCNSPEFGNPFGQITCEWFCGVSGWYTFQGSAYRDTDWYEIVVPAAGFVEVVGDAEFATYMFELAPQDCASTTVIQNVIMGPCNEATIVIPGAVGSTIWFWVGPTVFDGSGSYDYVLHTNLTCITATEPHSWTGVKSLFN